MSAYPAFAADGYTARWRTWDDQHTDDLTLTWENEAWTASGRLAREDVEYVIRLSPLWHVRQFLLFRDLAEPDLWLGTDGRGRWGEMNGAHRPELDGAHDIVLPITAFTHALPIRRVPLAVGDDFTISVLTVDTETLAVETHPLTYTRVAEHTWQVGDADSLVRFDVDEYGVPLDIPGLFRRVGDAA